MRNTILTIIFMSYFIANTALARSTCEEFKQNFMQAQNISELDDSIMDLSAENCHESSNHFAEIKKIMDSMPKCIDEVTAENARNRAVKKHLNYLEAVKKDSPEILQVYINEIISGFKNNVVFTYPVAWRADGRFDKLAMGFSKAKNNHDDYVQSPLIKICGDGIRVNNWNTKECVELKKLLYKLQELPRAVVEGIYVRANYNPDSKIPEMYSRVQDFVNYSFSEEDGKVLYDTKQDSEEKFNKHFKDIKKGLSRFNKNQCQTSGISGTGSILSVLSFYSSTQLMSALGAFKFTTQTKKDNWYNQLEVIYELVEPMSGDFNAHPPERVGEII